MRVVFGVIAGFFTWIVLWVGIEKTLIAVMPEWYGGPQFAFQHAVENRVVPFTAETHLLVSHVFIAAVAALASGFISAVIAGENRRTPVIVGILLFALGLLKVAMAWSQVPIWSHIAFTAILFPMAVGGGKLKKYQ